MIKVFCKNTGTYKMFVEGTSLLDILGEFQFERPYPIVSAKVNNVSQGLKFKVYNSRDVEFLDVREPSAMRVYRRSLSFLLSKAAQDVFPDCQIRIYYPISHGYFGKIYFSDKREMTPGDVEKVRARMQKMVDDSMHFHRHETQTDEVIKLFRERGCNEKVKLLETSGQVYMDYYTLGDTADYYYGRLVPNTSYLTVWGLEPFHDGFLLRFPDRKNPSILAESADQPKTFEVFKENLRWNKIMKLDYVGDVNHAIQNGRATELIQVAEALQEKKIVQIAEEINTRCNDEEKPLKLVLITGPSSSGKSTFSKRLSVQLKACGLRPLSFSTDDYFVNRIDTPKFPDGRYDFDNFDTVDHVALQQDLVKLLDGQTVDIPEYNFVTGRREYNGKHLQMTPGSVVILEGIHALNPALTNLIDESLKFRIFISTLTSISLDDHNAIPTSDNRLLRRIVRDYNKGAFTARESISQWPSVMAAEHKWIYPYQENADVMFNSAYLVEFAVLRNHAEAILASVPKNCPEYSEAHRLLKFIHYFTPVSDKQVPSTSLMREFLGGSSF